MRSEKRSDRMVMFAEADHAWNDIPAVHDAFSTNIEPKWHGQHVDAIPILDNGVHAGNTVFKSEGHLEFPTILHRTSPLKAPWNNTPTSCPLKTDGGFDTAAQAIDWNTPSFDESFDPALAAYDFLCMPYASTFERDIPHGLPYASTPWLFPSSFSDQSDCGQSFSSAASVDEPSRSSTYISNNMSSYVHTSACSRTDLGGSVDTQLSPDHQLPIGIQASHCTRPELDHKRRLPTLALPYRPEAPYHPTFATSERCGAATDGTQSPSQDIRSSWPPAEWEMEPRQVCIQQQLDTSQVMPLWTAGHISPSICPSRGCETVALAPSEQVVHQSPYPDATQGDMDTISHFPSARRKREDSFLVHAKGMGMTYKQIREKGGLQAAESTLRGRYRALTKERKDRVRKPVWTDNDLRLLQLAVRHEIDGLDASSAARGANIHVLGSKISWKKVADCIMAHGGSYRFGNATCKKKWKEMQH